MRYKCIICDSENVENLKTTKQEVFVTGDRKSFHSGGGYKRVICKNCGMIQFLQDEGYKQAIEEVYKNYDVMHDKMWFTSSGKKYKSRLQDTYEKINEALSLPKVGNMIDLGCGGGESLFWFNRIYPEWDLYGLDIGEQFRKKVVVRSKVKEFFASFKELRDSKIKFNFITINNVLSLADNPAEILKTVHECLTDDGIFFIKDADFEVHPWLLYEIESCSFYTKRHMESVIRRFNFDVMRTNYKHEKKEIGIFSKKAVIPEAVHENLYELNRKIYDRKIEFLDAVINRVQELCKKNTFIGIFGTSIAGVWISEILTKCNYADKKIFYIEEDEDYRKGVGVNGYPIYQLDEITEPAVIFLPFPQYIANDIKKRCEREYSNLEFIVFE